ncbi:MAG TPA: sucrase ferredoxin [Streptosporangiaceae bacterium]|nr:sucrase ferredoxin [Streptosporangiaceae bacterium]
MALVCTNGKRDRCCAVRGRPVAAAIADATGWDTWESSHLGGHRFAATALLSCGDTEPKAEVRYEAVGFTRIRWRAGEAAPGRRASWPCLA